MSRYRLYSLNGRRISGAEDIHASDDADAIGKAQAKALSGTFELWCGPRKLKVFPSEPSEPQAGQGLPEHFPANGGEQSAGV